MSEVEQLRSEVANLQKQINELQRDQKTSMTSRLRPPRIIIICGSIRSGSINMKLAEACYVASRSLTVGGKVPPPDVIKADQVAALQKNIPLYDGDLEQSGFPEAVVALQALLRQADGILLVCPEYNGDYTPLMKNTLDWLSRQAPGDQKYGSAYRGKMAAVVSTSPGGLGGMRSHVALRNLLLNLGCNVLGTSATIGRGFSAFNEDGSLKDESNQQKVYNVVNALCHHSAMMANSSVMRELIDSVITQDELNIAGNMGNI